MFPKKTTEELIENLAVAVHEGFKELREEVDEKFGGLQAEVREGLKKVDQRLTSVETELREVRHDVAHLSTQVGELQADLAMETSEIMDHEKRIVKLEKKVGV